MTVYSIGGLTYPPGGGLITAATDVPPNSVTYPDPGIVPDDPLGFNGDPHAYFKITAPLDGAVIFDSTLSFDPASGTSTPSTPNVNLSVFRSDVGASPASFADCTSLGLFTTGRDDLGVLTSRGQHAVTLVAGTTYIIVLWNFATPGTTNFILRVSDYGALSDWVQGPDEEWVLANPYGDDGTWHPASVVPLQWSSPAHTGTVADSPVDGPAISGGFHGSYVLSAALGAEEAGHLPPQDSDAITCSWSWARRGDWGGQIWSNDPSNPDPSISGVWTGGGICLDHATDPDTTPVSDSPDESKCGVIWSGEYPTLGHASTNFDTYTTTERMWLRPVIDILGPWAGQALPTDSPFAPGATLFWETPLAELLGVDAAPDQGLGGLYFEDVADPLQIDWAIKAVGPLHSDGPYPDEENPDGVWGPRLDQDDADPDLWEYVFHGSVDNGTWAEDAEVELPTFTNQELDDHTWTAIPPDTLLAALGYEDEWQAIQDNGGFDPDRGDAFYPLAAVSEFKGGLRCLAMPHALQERTQPGFNYAAWPDPGGLTLFENWYRTEQTVAFRMSLRPARHRWQAGPVLPALDVLLTDPLRVYPRDDIEGTGTADRLYAGGKADRVYGGYPG